jgi:hypothetical protein
MASGTIRKPDKNVHFFDGLVLECALLAKMGHWLTGNQTIRQPDYFGTLEFLTSSVKGSHCFAILQLALTGLV